MNIKHYIIKLLTASCVLTSFFTSAYTVNITIDGGSLTYDNAYKFSGDNYVTSDWNIVTESLYPTTQWQPGLLSSTNTTLQLTGSGLTVDIPIKILGAQFGMNSAALGLDSALFSSGSNCELTTDGTTVSFYNPNPSASVGHAQGSCSAPNSILISQNKPFYFVRPIFQLDERAFFDAMQVATSGQTILPNTILTGSVSTSLRYFFKYGTTTTVRNMPVQNFTVRVIYNPGYLTDVEVTPFKEITPVYDTSTNTAEGSAFFDVTPIGTYTNGIKMTFFKDDYKMIHQGLFSEEVVTGTDSNGNPIYGSTEDGYIDRTREIPYYIKCAVCVPSDMESGYIVKNGVLTRNQSTMVVKADINGTDVTYQLEVGFEDIPATSVISGLYMDTFTVMFELDY